MHSVNFSRDSNILACARIERTESATDRFFLTLWDLTTGARHAEDTDDTTILSDSSRFHTNTLTHVRNNLYAGCTNGRGQLSLPANCSRIHPFRYQVDRDNTEWVSFGKAKLLWLPREYRPTSNWGPGFAEMASTIAIATEDNRVYSIKFETDELLRVYPGLVEVNTEVDGETKD